MMTFLVGIKYSKLLVGQPVAADAVAVEHTGVCCETRKHCGFGVPLGPIEDFPKQSPIRFIAQISMVRLCTCDNYTVEPVLPEIVKRTIKSIQMACAPACSGNSRQ